MCQDCGCEAGNARTYLDLLANPHTHDRPHTHHHGNGDGHTHVTSVGEKDIHVHVHVHLPHDHDDEHEHSSGNGHHRSHHSHATFSESAAVRRTRTIELETRVTEENDKLAARNRNWLKERGVASVNLISSPGSGKTRLLERTLEALDGKIPCAVITGDQMTDNDARRLQGKGAPVVHIETRSSCHLNAQQVAEKLESVIEDGAKLLFIENVGNLVCPAAFDLGEEKKIALLSVTEGEDKPVKYPVLFHAAPVCVITKTDLLEHLSVDMEKLRASIRKVRPDAKILELSAETGDGMDTWIEFLCDSVESTQLREERTIDQHPAHSPHM